MKNCDVKKKGLTIVCSGEVVSLKIKPLTFRLIGVISESLGDGKDLATVMENPTQIDLAIVTYCLLDKSSKKKIDDIKLVFADIDDEVEATEAEKLYYMMSENNVTDGMNNYTAILTAVIDQLRDSTEQPETKKKTILQKLFPFQLKKHTIL